LDAGFPQTCPTRLTTIGPGWDSPAVMPTVFRTVRRLAGAAALVLLGLASTACEEQTPDKKGPKSAADPAEQARIEQGKKLLSEADDAINVKKYDQARKFLVKAGELGVESQRFRVEEALEKVDKRQAKLWANEVAEDLSAKNCANVFKTLEEPLKRLADSEAFTRELHKLVGAEALACVQHEVDEKVLGQDYTGARKQANSEQTKTVLGQYAWKKLVTELEATITEGLRGQITSDLKAHKWTAAGEKVEALLKKGDATEEQAEVLFQNVREGVGPEIAQMAARALGQKDAPGVLKQVDALARAAHWVIMDAGVAALSVGVALPEDLAKKRAALAIWVEAQHQAMRPIARPELRWAHGRIAVTPPDNADAPSKRDIPHGTKVWLLGIGKGKALITTTDPAGARLVDLIDKAVGWAPTDRLVKQDTADWLVPDDQLKGQRVWGPLRPGDFWELGVVMNVVGHDITVQRLADGQNFKLPRAKLRSGRLAPGTRVLTFCVAKEQPAQIVEVPPSGRSAKLKCDGGQEKEEDLASLRSKPELLPTTR